MTAGDFGLKRHGIPRVVMGGQNDILMPGESLSKRFWHLSDINQAFVKDCMDRPRIGLEKNGFCPHISRIGKPDMGMALRAFFKRSMDTGMGKRTAMHEKPLFYCTAKTSVAKRGYKEVNDLKSAA